MGRCALPYALTLLVLTTTLATLNATYSPSASALSASYGDGIAVYGQTSNTKPQFRTYSASGNSFGAAADTATGAAGSTFVTRTSPTKQEAMAGYVDTTGTLRLLCYDG